MKRLIVLVCAAMLAFTLSPAMADEKPRLGILRFTNDTHAGWWSGDMAREMQDMLISELATMGTFTVIERKEIDAALKEQDLSISGRVNKGTAVKFGNLTGAKYLVSGTVTAYEESTSGGGGGISIGGISVGGSKSETYMAVDLKVMDAETGEIADSRAVEARSGGGGLSLGLNMRGFSGNLGGFEKTPAGKAIRACIMEIAEYLDCSLNEGKNAPCMAEYNAKEQKRREKTKSSIKLD